MLGTSLNSSIPHERTATLIDEEVRLAGLGETRKRSNAEILGFLSRALSRDRRTLLDVGCGPGFFLLDACAAGFVCKGIEPDANVVDQARTMSGLTIRHGYFPAAIDADERFDVIVFNDVLEHIPLVEDAVHACYSFLQPGGILVLNCPDQNGIFYRLAELLDRFGISGPYKRMWQFGLPSPHVWYFSAEHLGKLGCKAGLQPLGVCRLPAINAKGLRERISYVKGQSKVTNAVTAVGVLAFLPFTRILPRDTSIVFLRKPKSLIFSPHPKEPASRI